MRKYLFPFAYTVLLLFISLSPIYGQERNIDEEGHPYNIYVPKDYKKGEEVPLIIALHGAGSDEGQFMQLFRYGAEENMCILLSPKSAGVAWSPNDRNRVMKLARQTKRKYSISSVYIIGFSNGGAMAYLFALQNLTFFKGVGGFSDVFSMGRIPPNFSHMHIFISKGTRDNIEMTRRMKDLLIANGNPVEYHEIENGGHTIHQDSIPKFYAWLNKIEKRDPGKHLRAYQDALQSEKPYVLFTFHSEEEKSFTTTCREALEQEDVQSLFDESFPLIEIDLARALHRDETDLEESILQVINGKGKVLKSFTKGKVSSQTLIKYMKKAKK